RFNISNSPFRPLTREHRQKSVDVDATFLLGSPPAGARCAASALRGMTRVQPVVSLAWCVAAKPSRYLDATASPRLSRLQRPCPPSSSNARPCTGSLCFCKDREAASREAQPPTVPPVAGRHRGPQGGSAFPR